MKTTKFLGGFAPVALAVVLLLAGCAESDPQKMVESARQYLGKNDTAAAIIQLKNALQKNPDLAEARFLLGQALFLNGDPVGAKAELQKARNLGYPLDKLAPLMVRSMLALGEFKQVTEEFDKVEVTAPEDAAELKTLMAVAWRQQGKQENFEVSLQQALAAKPDHPPALIEQARFKSARRDYDGALAILDKVLAAAPKNEDALQLKGDIVFYGTGDAQKGMALYREAAQANPKFPDAQASIIRILLSQGQLAEASVEMEKLTKLAKGAPTTVYLQALLAFEKKDYPAAREYSQQMLRYAPNSPKALEMAGSTELQLNSLGQAEAHLTKALSAMPTLKVARRALVLTLLKTGQTDKALAALPADIATNNTDPALLTAAGQVHLVRGDLDQAQALFARASQLDPQDPAKRTSLAVSQLMSGKTELAMNSLQGIAADDSGVVADLALINAHLRKRDVDKALVAIDALEKKRANDPMPSLLRGRANLLRNDRETARKSFERALEIAPGYMAAIAALVTLDVAEGKPQEAQRRLEAEVKRDPKNSQALIALAEIKAKSGAAKEEVLDILRKAIDAAPNEKIPRVMLVEYLLQQKDPRGALSSAQGAVLAVPDAPELIDALGRAQAANGEYNQAMSSFNKLAGLLPQSAQPHLRIASVHAALKNSAAAQQSLHRALELQPNFLNAQRALVELAMQDKKPADALLISKTVQKQRPKEGVGFLMEGDIHFSSRNWTNAVEAYRSGLKAAPSTELAIKLQTALGFAGKLAEADRSGAEWVKSHPNDVGFLLFLGDRALSIKNLQEAQRQYERVIELQPKNALALNNLAWVAGRLGRADALSLAERAVAAAPNQPAFMDTLAGLLSEKGEHAKALEIQKKVVLAQPNSPTFKLNLAKIYLASGDKSSARPLLDELEALGDKFRGQSEVTKMKSAL
ncbi:XrtA/PEP-CTERM system TPR-repeat protein PrsT [Hydrogenophaga sp. PBL-H3]|uniref:XrtA/PEP-CTERM system TPR-repeat protein PrsT n=1 Tax=Hydrogenophaga sp. PBL-H3 TaxID=434010 RepID=UPI00132031CB|nr:XrtA/PEP-CTERM system TPR-repeat protein PrsT [Hydrogenophaga sp. PBL-H3]QHE76684.1 PEP-CTERM system TPR-repeat protein PrsT [Hydrogenophaga sp. PBL-H3]QHE81108.1 PEP-CTERM system TPR-repeat protein PrsT [Hydrogenophaga sp. PBL-H3]